MTVWIFFRREWNTKKQAQYFGDQKTWVEKFTYNVTEAVGKEELIEIVKNQIKLGNQEEGEWLARPAEPAGFDSAHTVRLGYISVW